MIVRRLRFENRCYFKLYLKGDESMRGAFFVVVLIAMLIVGILVVKDMKTETVDGVERDKTVEKAQETARHAEEAMDRIKETAKNIEIPALE